MSKILKHPVFFIFTSINSIINIIFLLNRLILVFILNLNSFLPYHHYHHTFLLMETKIDFSFILFFPFYCFFLHSLNIVLIFFLTYIIYHSFYHHLYASPSSLSSSSSSSPPFLLPSNLLCHFVIRLLFFLQFMIISISITTSCSYPSSPS